MSNVGDCRCFCCRCWGHFPSNSARRRLFCQLSANTKVLRRCQVFSALFIFIFLSFPLRGQKVWRMSWENNLLSTSKIISGCFYFETLAIANFHVRSCLSPFTPRFKDIFSRISRRWNHCLVGQREVWVLLSELHITEAPQLLRSVFPPLSCLVTSGAVVICSSLSLLTLPAVRRKG